LVTIQEKTILSFLKIMGYRKFTLDDYYYVQELLSKNVQLNQIGKLVGLDTKTVTLVKRNMYEIIDGQVCRTKELRDLEKAKREERKANPIALPITDEQDFYQKHPIEPNIEIWDGQKNAVQLNADYYSRYLEIRHQQMYHPGYHPMAYNMSKAEQAID
jgi:hypothetical protein